jgi:hypothetical protein
MGVLSEAILDIMKLLKSSEQDKMKERLTRYVKNFEKRDDTVEAGNSTDANEDVSNKNK